VESARGQNVIGHTPLKRFGEAKELLGAVSWLLNDELAGFVTGVTLPVDGGFLASSGI
jgi:NAD(P)-dependent dehydrogenase (short-subunit alcohol dehydrogenase family)